MPEPVAAAVAAQPPPVVLTLREFLESVPPQRITRIAPLARERGNALVLVFTDIELHCTSDECQGMRFFAPAEEYSASRPGGSKSLFVTYTCRNCDKTEKKYALRVWLNTDAVSGQMFKYGESPDFGPPVPARLITLIGEEREYFLKGRRSENQGAGIAAFAYYRRVVENRQQQIISEIIRVAEKIGATADVLQDLQAAKSETQFSKAVAAIKHGIPQALLVQGHNPLMLLHSALSDGLHSRTDDECLVLATSIRVVLSDLVERMASALREGHELNSAVAALLNETAKKGARRGG